MVGGQKDLITMKKGFVGLKITMKTYSKCFKILSNGIFADFVKKLYYILAQLSQKVIVIETNWPLFSAERGGQCDQVEA